MRRARYSAVVVMLLSIGCMHDKKPDTQPPPVAAKPETPKTPQTTKAAPATGAKTPPSTKAPSAKAPSSTAKARPAPANTAKTAPPATTRPQPATAPSKTTTATPTLDLAALEARLKQTKAIGVMTKLSLKNQVNDLLDEFREHHAGKAMPTVAELRRAYDLLMMKVLSLLQDGDKQLASDILTSRERIWGLLVNPKTFAALEAE